MSRPWMPLYVADYLADTGHLTTVEHGAYLLLIMHYWRHRGLPNDDAQLARIARLNPPLWDGMRETIRAFFDGTTWTHSRIDRELLKYDDFLEKQRSNGSRGGRKANPTATQAEPTANPTAKPKKAISQPQPDISKEIDSEFAEFWKAYPRKADKKGARAAYAKARKTAAAEVILTAVKHFAEQVQGKDQQYVPYGVRWLSHERWADEPTPAVQPASKQANGHGGPEPWDKRVADFQATGFWIGAWGGKPGEKFCHVPLEILERHGYAEGKR